MLARSALLEIERSLRGAFVLSAYVDRSELDIAKRDEWRVRLSNEAAALERLVIGASHAEQESLRKCIEHLFDGLARIRGHNGAHSWVAFVTAAGIAHTALLPTPVRTQLMWGTAISIGPYLRAIDDARPVIVVHADSVHADVYRCVAGELHALHSFRAHHPVMPPSHMGDAPSRGFHSGARGDTGHDQAQRSLLAGTRRLLRDTCEYVTRAAEADAWIVIAGGPQTARALADDVSALLPGRVWCARGVDIHASPAELIEAAKRAATELRDAADERRVAELLAEREPVGLGVAGTRRVREKLNDRQIQEMFVTSTWADSHAMEMEDVIRAASDQGARVTEVSGPAGALLDARGGVAASLRYRVAGDATRATR